MEWFSSLKEQRNRLNKIKNDITKDNITVYLYILIL